MKNRYNRVINEATMLSTMLAVCPTTVNNFGMAFLIVSVKSLLEAADKGQNFWVVFGTAILVFAIIQLLCDLVVTPRIMGKTMNLNPAILLLSLSVWGALLGFIGLIIALPLTTLIIAYWKRYVTKEDENKQKEMLIENDNPTSNHAEN